MGFLGGGSFNMPDPFSPQAVAMRQEELQWQQEMARDEQAFQRSRAIEDREWQEDLEDRRALRKQKEEEERIRELKAEQMESLQEVEEEIQANLADEDESYTDMWRSLSTGTSGARNAARSQRTGRVKDDRSFADSFSSFLTGGDV